MKSFFRTILKSIYRLKFNKKFVVTYKNILSLEKNEKLLGICYLKNREKLLGIF